MEKSDPKPLKKEQIAELKQAFDYFDTEHKLELGLKELKVIAKHLDRNLSDDELMAVVQAVDKSNSEAIKYEDFIDYMQKIEYKPPSMALIENEFSMLDRTNCGYITVNNFYDMMRRIKCNYSKKVIEDMVAAIDSDKNNRITLDEFMNLFY